MDWMCRAARVGWLGVGRGSWKPERSIGVTGVTVGNGPLLEMLAAPPTPPRAEALSSQIGSQLTQQSTSSEWVGWPKTSRNAIVSRAGSRAGMTRCAPGLAPDGCMCSYELACACACTGCMQLACACACTDCMPSHSSTHLGALGCGRCTRSAIGEPATFTPCRLTHTEYVPEVESLNSTAYRPSPVSSTRACT